MRPAVRGICFFCVSKVRKMKTRTVLLRILPVTLQPALPPLALRTARATSRDRGVVVRGSVGGRWCAISIRIQVRIGEGGTQQAALDSSLYHTPGTKLGGKRLMLHSMLHSWSSLSAPSFFWKVSHFRMTFCSLRSKPIFFVARQMSTVAQILMRTDLRSSWRGRLSRGR